MVRAACFLHGVQGALGFLDQFVSLLAIETLARHRNTINARIGSTR
jgi:hypothetical protein